MSQKFDHGPVTTELSPKASLQIQQIKFERQKFASELVSQGGLSPEAVIRCAQITAEGKGSLPKL